MACGFTDAFGREHVYFAKGDAEVILRMCADYRTAWGEIRPLGSLLPAARARTDAMSKDGSVVIALAYRTGRYEKPPSRYIFLCLFQLDNPLKAETGEVLHRLRERGIRNVILTGDRTETARRVAAQSSIENDAKFYLTGKDIDKMSLSEIARQSEYISVFTRLTPSQKGTVVRAFQQRGHRVAMVGDGANDVIAFRFADAGLSFFEQSSPLARRTAKVLINDITDVLLVIRTAAHIREQVRLIALFTRVIFLAMLFASIYFSVKGLL